MVTLFYIQHGLAVATFILQMIHFKIANKKCVSLPSFHQYRIIFHFAYADRLRQQCMHIMMHKERKGKIYKEKHEEEVIYGMKNKTGQRQRSRQVAK